MLTLLLGCATGTADATRQAWLVDALLDDNLRWLSRDPALVEEKLARMAADPYDWLRGTAGVSARDQARPGTGRDASAFATSPEAWGVLVAGDVHPENVGLLMPEDGPGPGPEGVPVLLLEVVDLDGAAFGPYTADTRRAALGLALLVEEAGCVGTCRDRVVEAHARAWLDELGRPAFRPGLVAGEVGAVLQRLLDDAVPEGQGRELLAEVTELTAGGRRFRLDEEVVRLTAEEDAELDRLLDGYAAPPAFRELDRARRYGVGVNSLPAIRYVVAWDRGGDGPEDDELLSIREVVDPPVLPGVRAEAPGRFRSNADRLEEASRALWSRPDADPRLDGLTDGPVSFKVQTWSSWNTNLDHAKIARDFGAGRFGPADLEAWADTLGRQLAGVHARAPLATGGTALPVVLTDVAGREEAFVAERLRDVEHDLRALRRDHALFVDALDVLGPLLGADRWETW